MQLMPGTADRFGVTDACDAATNIDGGVRYLAWLTEKFGNPLLVAALPCAAQTARPTLELADGHHAIQLSPYVGYRQDTGAVDKAADAFRRAAAGEFAPLPDGQSEFGK